MKLIDAEHLITRATEVGTIDDRWDCYAQTTDDFVDYINDEPTINAIPIPEDSANAQVFIHVFGIDAWTQMMEFSNLNDKFKEFWNAKYKGVSE